MPVMHLAKQSSVSLALLFVPLCLSICIVLLLLLLLAHVLLQLVLAHACTFSF